MKTLIINGRIIHDYAPCYVIAELGGNHGGDLQTALTMIRMASRAGVDAVKLQTRTNDRLYTSESLARPYHSENSYGPTYGAHRAALEFNDEQLRVCQETAEEEALTCFSTAFDEWAVDRLMRHHVPAIKIHSGGLTDEPLLKHAGQQGVPLIVSTGAGSLSDIDHAHELLSGVPHAFLHCTASYPLQPTEANLRVISMLRERYPDTVIGFSSHAPGIHLSLVAYALGARIIEHHVTLNRASKGTDHAFSLEPKGLETLVSDLESCRLALGTGKKECYPSEVAPISKMRRVQTPEGWRIP